MLQGVVTNAKGGGHDEVVPENTTAEILSQNLSKILAANSKNNLPKHSQDNNTAKNKPYIPKSKPMQILSNFKCQKLPASCPNLSTYELNEPKEKDPKSPHKNPNPTPVWPKNP